MDENTSSALGVQLWELVVEGFNERLDPLQAAILRAKLPTLDDRIAARRAAARKYDQLLADLDVITPYEAQHAKHVYRAYTVMVENREHVRSHLASKGISSRVYYIPPLHLQPAYDHLGLRPGEFPVTEQTSAAMLSLPIFPEITDEQIGEVVNALEEAVSLYV
jgi:dTDP-4-amino-4,6-dideoxygalactose transaminase